MAFLYREQMEAELGAPLPAPDEELPQALEKRLAGLLAKAGQQLTQEKQANAAQAAAQQQAQDPVFQMKQAELQIKQGELQRKAAKDAMDGALEQERLNSTKRKQPLLLHWKQTA